MFFEAQMSKFLQPLLARRQEDRIRPSEELLRELKTETWRNRRRETAVAHRPRVKRIQICTKKAQQSVVSFSSSKISTVTSMQTAH